MALSAEDHTIQQAFGAGLASGASSGLLIEGVELAIGGEDGPLSAKLAIAGGTGLAAGLIVGFIPRLDRTGQAKGSSPKTPIDEYGP